MINWRKCHPDVELLWIIFLPCKGRQRLPNLLVRAVLSGAPDCPRDMYRINTTCYCSVVPYSSKWVSRHIAGDSSIQASVTRSPEREVLFSSASTADWLKLLPGRGQQPTVPHLSRDVNTCSSIRSLYRLRGLISEYSQLTALQRVYLEYWDTYNSTSSDFLLLLRNAINGDDPQSETPLCSRHCIYPPACFQKQNRKHMLSQTWYPFYLALDQCVAYTYIYLEATSSIVCFIPWYVGVLNCRSVCDTPPMNWPEYTQRGGFC